MPRSVNITKCVILLFKLNSATSTLSNSLASLDLAQCMAAIVPLQHKLLQKPPLKLQTVEHGQSRANNQPLNKCSG